MNLPPHHGDRQLLPARLLLEVPEEIKATTHKQLLGEMHKLLPSLKCFQERWIRPFEIILDNLLFQILHLFSHI